MDFLIRNCILSSTLYLCIIRGYLCIIRGLCLEKPYLLYFKENIRDFQGYFDFRLFLPNCLG